MQTTPLKTQQKKPFSVHKVVLIGASARAAATSATSVGLRVAAIDRFGDSDLRQICDPYLKLRSPESGSQSLPADLAAVRATAPETPIVVIGAGGIELLQAELETARAALECSAVRFLIPSTDAFQRAAEPTELERIATAAGLRFPRWFRTNPGEQLRGQAGWLWKPVVRCGGLGVQPWCESTPQSEDGYIQQHVAGHLLGVSYCAGPNGVRCLGVCRGLLRRAIANPFGYAGSVGPLKVAPAMAKRLALLGQAVATHCGIRGLFGVDLIQRQSELFLLDINLRYCASMELLDSSEQNSISLHLKAWMSAEGSGSSERLAEDTPFGPHEQRVRESIIRCKRILYAERKLVWSLAIARRFDDFRQTVADEGWQVTWHDLPSEGITIEAETPLITLITSAPLPSIAFRRALACSRRLRKALRQWD